MSSLEELIVKTAPNKRSIDPGLGCSPEEIELVAASQGTALPAVYVQFLAKLGKSTARLSSGDYEHFPAILENKQEALTILEGCDSEYVLPQDAVVFSTHDGYQFLFMRQSEGDDPPVYSYVEGDSAPRQACPSYSEYLLSALRRYLR